VIDGCAKQFPRGKIGLSGKLAPGGADAQQGAEFSGKGDFKGTNGLEPHLGSQVRSCFNWLWFNWLGDYQATAGKKA
jgi:hypothetical protein